MKINKDFVLREIAGDYILVPVGSTALEFNGLITLNEVGTFLWGKLQGETSKDDLVAELLGEYDVDEETAKHDVDEFLESLKKAEIIA